MESFYYQVGRSCFASTTCIKWPPHTQSGGCLTSHQHLQTSSLISITCWPDSPKHDNDPHLTFYFNEQIIFITNSYRCNLLPLLSCSIPLSRFLFFFTLGKELLFLQMSTQPAWTVTSIIYTVLRKRSKNSSSTWSLLMFRSLQIWKIWWYSL